MIKDKVFCGQHDSDYPDFYMDAYSPFRSGRSHISTFTL